MAESDRAKGVCMSVGSEILAFVLANILFFGLNLGFLYNNWRVRKKARELCILAHRIYDDALEFRAGEYKLCKTCGRIVQGICLECTTNLPVE